jgi:hypothetical protein
MISFGVKIFEFALRLFYDRHYILIVIINIRRDRNCLDHKIIIIMIIIKYTQFILILRVIMGMILQHIRDCSVKRVNVIIVKTTHAIGSDLPTSPNDSCPLKTNACFHFVISTSTISSDCDDIE